MNKIDLIIDALECAVSDEMFELGKYEAALAAARELQALKPVGITDSEYDGKAALFDDVVLPDTTLLYALDEVTK